MSVGKRRRDLREKPHSVCNGKLAALVEMSSQRLTFDKRHDEIRNSVDLTRRKQRHDVRVLQARRDLNLTPESLDSDALEMFRQNFHEHFSAVAPLLGQE